MSEYRIVRAYPHAIGKVWRALTDPALIPLWTATGKGARPVGFATEVGTRFQFVAKPMPGWNGVVDCELLEARAPSLLRYSWQGGSDDDVTEVICRLEPHGDGTQLTFAHTGFTGIGGFVVSKILAAARRKMLTVGLTALLAELDDDGRLRPNSPLRSRV